MRYESDGTEGSAIACVTNARYEITHVNRTGEHLISGATAALPRLWWGAGGIHGARVR
jgi:hypothetical protein